MSAMNRQTESSIMETCFMQATPCLYSHVYMLQHDKDVYLQTLTTLCDKGLISSTTQAIKARIIAALHIAQEHEALKKLLKFCDVVEILKALSMLDRPRQLRQLQRKVQMIESLHPHVVLENLRLDDGSAHVSVRRSGRQRRQRGGRRRPDSVEEHLRAPGASRLTRRQRQKGLRRLRTELKELESQGDHLHTPNSCSSFSTAHSDAAVREMIESSSVSGALALKIREWARTQLTTDFLEFVVLTMPVSQWKRLADLVHFHPSDFTLDYFLGFVHGGSLPDGSFPKDMQAFLNAPLASRPSVFAGLMKRHPHAYLNYVYFRTLPEVMSGHGSILEMLAKRIPLDTAVWYLEELAAQSKNDVVPNIVARRIRCEDLLSSGGKTKVTTFGKLVERILTFQARKWSPLVDALMPIAEQRLGALKEEWASHANSSCRTAVFGDASSSMTTAIQAATILASMISVCWNGELSFFHSTQLPSPYPRPATVNQVLEVCHKVRATGCTSLASALWPYYEKKRVLDRIVMVTDEEENTQCHGYMFARLLHAYKQEVNANVELIVVGVGSGDRRFQASLNQYGIICKRIEIDKNRPDLSKFDALLGQIAMASSNVMGVTRERESADDFVVL